MFAKISVKFWYYTVFIFCYFTEGPCGTIFFERPYNVIVAQVSDLAPWTSCFKPCYTEKRNFIIIKKYFNRANLFKLELPNLATISNIKFEAFLWRHMYFLITWRAYPNTASAVYKWHRRKWIMTVNQEYLYEISIDNFFWPIFSFNFTQNKLRLC